MARYGPGRAEHKVRLAISLFGLCLMMIAVLSRDFDSIAWIEVAVIGTAFFGGSAAWSALRLIRDRPAKPDDARRRLAETHRAPR